MYGASPGQSIFQSFSAASLFLGSPGSVYMSKYKLCECFERLWLGRFIFEVWTVRWPSGQMNPKKEKSSIGGKKDVCATVALDLTATSHVFFELVLLRNETRSSSSSTWSTNEGKNCREQPHLLAVLFLPPTTFFTTSAACLCSLSHSSLGCKLLQSPLHQPNWRWA